MFKVYSYMQDSTTWVKQKGVPRSPGADNGRSLRRLGCKRAPCSVIVITNSGSRARSPAGLVSRGKRVTPSGFTTSPYLAPGESDCGSMALSGCCGHALVVLGRNSPGATGLVRFIETARVARPLQTVNATRRNVVTLLPRCFHEKPLVHRTQLVAVEILLAACDMPANSRMDRNYITRSHGPRCPRLQAVLSIFPCLSRVAMAL